MIFKKTFGWLTLFIVLWTIVGCNNTQQKIVSSGKINDVEASQSTTLSNNTFSGTDNASLISWKVLKNLKEETELSNNTGTFLTGHGLNLSWEKNNDISVSLSNSDKDYAKQQEVVKKLKAYIEQKENESEEAFEKLDLSYCNRYKTKESTLDCKLKMIFSKYNKQGCDLVKNKDNQLYEKCLEVKKGIEEWKKIRKYKYYYDKYLQDGY